MLPEDQTRALPTVAKTLAAHKQAVARCFLPPVADWEKWAPAVESMGVERFLEVEMVPPADFLINFLRTGDATWQALYLGHQLDQLHWAADDKAAMLRRVASVFEQHRTALLALLRPLADAESAAAFEALLVSMHSMILDNLERGAEARVLLIGDCLLEDITRFITVPLLQQGVILRPEYATSKNPIELRNSLRGFAASKPDMVCFSPYSSEFNLTMLEVFFDPNPLQSRKKLQALAEKAHAQTKSTLRSLASHFECSIFVQNTLNVRRFDGTRSSYVKTWITHRPRKIAAEVASALLDSTLTEMNEDLPRPLVKIDEVALGEHDDDIALGKTYYDSERHHPTLISQKLSVLYRDLILSRKLLATKKLVVVDLDDTVWAGTIGEGAVEHFKDRQQILQELRLKGILLAIASKNDPEKVHWTGGVLRSEDFVAEKINWDLKATNIKQIAQELNLKAKDFVFIDDRAEQREMVKAVIPEIQVLDATVPATWEMLRWWAAALPEQTEGDRTQLYHERKKRESFLREETDTADQNILFESLGIKVDLRVAAKKELPRVAELINRTNQFNTTASRTSLGQVTEWSESADHIILVAEGRDKFGDMGIVSAMVLDATAAALEVSIWVLSCRVFGYGIETALLNEVRRLGQGMGWATLRGKIVETPANGPCREVYATHGFVLEGDVWVGDTATVTADPVWLGVTSHVSEALLSSRV